MKTAKIKCTKCGTTLSVDELLIQQFESSIRMDLESEMQSREHELNLQRQEFKELSMKFQQEKADVDKLVKSQLKSREELLKDSIRKQIDEEKSLQLQELEDELTRKSAELKSMNQTKAQMIRLQREMEEQEARIVMEKEEELNKRLEQARLTIREQADNENLLRMKEKEKLILDLKVKLTEAQRKVNQGSMQVQGQVQELEIISLLQESFPYDEITQSKTGANAADVLQVVKTRKGATIGSIYIESKRTQSYSEKWIPKFKNDNLSVNADVLILVTETLPKGIERYGLIDDVWVCEFDANSLRQLLLVIRYGLLKVYTVIQHQQGAKEKSELLYRYITSNEFQNLFEAIISGFKSIQDSHHSEQLKLKRLWVEREKQLGQILSNLVEHYASLRNIGGESIAEIKLLEFMPMAS